MPLRKKNYFFAASLTLPTNSTQSVKTIFYRYFAKTLHDDFSTIFCKDIANIYINYIEPEVQIENCGIKRRVCTLMRLMQFMIHAVLTVFFVLKRLKKGEKTT